MDLEPDLGLPVVVLAHPGFERRLAAEGFDPGGIGNEGRHCWVISVERLRCCAHRVARCHGNPGRRLVVGARVALAALALAIAGCPAAKPGPSSPAPSPSKPPAPLGQLRLVVSPEIGPQVLNVATDAARRTLAVTTLDSRLGDRPRRSPRAAWPLAELIAKGRCSIGSDSSPGFGFIDVGISHDGSEAWFMGMQGSKRPAYRRAGRGMPRRHDLWSRPPAPRGDR